MSDVPADIAPIIPENARPAVRSFAMLMNARVWRPVTTFIGVLLLWEITVRLTGVSPILLPPPSDIARKLVDIYPLLLANVGQTFMETVASLVLSTAVGVILAVALVSSRTLDECVYPNLVVLQIVPKIAMAPLFVAWLGFAPISRISFAVLLSFFPVFLATYDGLRQVAPDALLLCRALHASRLRVLLKLRFPFAVPMIFSGMKTTATLSVIGVVIGEFIASQGGLGYLILLFSAQQQTDVSMAAIACLCMGGLLLYGAVSLAERIARERLGFEPQ